MIAAEPATYHVPEDPGSPVPVGGYVVACVTFYEQGLGASSHRFLRYLLWFYGMELHHLTPSRILHITIFVTLCEAYMGIEPHFDLWNHFFCVRLLPSSGTEAVVFGGVDIYVKYGHGFNPCFHLPMPGSMDGWWKVRFFLRNNADASLPVFTSSLLFPQRN
jgi:hypothetical protein